MGNASCHRFALWTWGTVHGSYLDGWHT